MGMCLLYGAPSQTPSQITLPRQDSLPIKRPSIYESCLSNCHSDAVHLFPESALISQTLLCSARQLEETHLTKQRNSVLDLDSPLQLHKDFEILSDYIPRSSDSLRNQRANRYGSTFKKQQPPGGLKTTFTIIEVQNFPIKSQESAQNEFGSEIRNSNNVKGLQ